MDGVLERHGRIDVLVNNAGGQYMTPAEDITPKGFRTVIRLNVEGTWLMSHAVATKAMIPGRGRQDRERHALAAPRPARAWRTPRRRGPRWRTSPACCRSSGPASASRSPRSPPGHFATETLRTKYPKPVVEGVAGTVPLGRLGTEEEFAWLVAFLASPGGDYHSGSIITIDGARDNWSGPWPPGGLADEGGKPLAEERGRNERAEGRA